MSIDINARTTAASDISLPLMHNIPHYSLRTRARLGYKYNLPGDKMKNQRAQTLNTRRDISSLIHDKDIYFIILGLHINQIYVKIYITKEII